MLLRIFILLLMSTSVNAQIGTNKVTPQHYHFCSLIYDKELKDSFCLDQVSISFPIIQTGDNELDSFLNDTIRHIVATGGMADSYPLDIHDTAECECPLDTSGLYGSPSTEYKIHLMNTRFLSLNFFQYSHAGGGANGSSNLYFPLTVDLKTHKTIHLNEAIKKDAADTIFVIAAKQLKANNDNLMAFWENEANLSEISKIWHYPILITPEGIIVYWNLSYGKGSADVPVYLNFEEHKQLFRQEFLKAVLSN